MRNQPESCHQNKTVGRNESRRISTFLKLAFLSAIPAGSPKPALRRTESGVIHHFADLTFHHLCFHHILFFLGMLLFVSTISAQELTGAQSGVLPSGVYHAVESIWVNSNDEWELSPGTIIEFDPGTSLAVSGRLTAFGEADDSIRFRSYEAEQRWNGIKFQPTNYYSYMEYCVVTGSQQTGVIVENYGALKIKHSRISNNLNVETGIGGMYFNSPLHDTLSYMTFSDNIGTGFKYFRGGIDLYNSGFYNNTGTGLEIQSADPFVDSCVFEGNQGGGVRSAGSHTELRHCVFINNYAERGGAINAGAFYTVFVTRSLFIGNQAQDEGGAVYAAPLHGTSVVMSHDYFAENVATEGSAISANYPAIMNSIVVNHPTGAAAIHGRDSDATCIYNLFYNNGGGDITIQPGNFQDQFGVLSTVNLNGDSCDTFSNLFQDPQLIIDDIAAYSLLSTSPCINAAHPDSTYDPDSTIADIGVFYYDLLNSIAEEIASSPEMPHLLAWPNPTNGSLTLSIPAGSFIEEVNVYNLLGERVFSLKQARGLARSAVPLTLPNHLASGTYLLQIGGSKGTSVARIVLLK